jgi:serine protease Do
MVPSQVRQPVLDAKVVRTFDAADVAVLKIDATGVPVLPLADVSEIQQGDLVFAIGNPEGLNNSLSMGVVSALGRPRESEAAPLYIQTDAAINPGSSGGALVNIHGQLIGMTSFILTEGGGSEGLGFALPSNLLYLIYKELRSKGHIEVGDVGLKVQAITSTMAAGLGLSQGSGLIVSDVDVDGPSDAAGIRPQDILIALDGSPITTIAQYATAF